MSLKADPKYVAEQMRSTSESTSDEIASVFEPLWRGREEITRIVLSLASAILAGTISFSDSLIGSAASELAVWVLVASWVLFLFSICFGLGALWSANTLRSFRARFANSEPAIKEEVANLSADNQKELIKQVLAVVGKYSQRSLDPVGKSDVRSRNLAGACLVCFTLALAAFVLVGGILAYNETLQPTAQSAAALWVPSAASGCSGVG